MNIRTVSDIAYSDAANKDRMERMNAVYYQMADYIREHNPEAYEQFVHEAEKVVYEISLTDAMNIVAKMSPMGERWSYDTIRSYVAERGQEQEAMHYYLVMNMAYNDYRRTAEKYGLDRPDFYYDLAWDFINDPDACSFKVEKYFL